MKLYFDTYHAFLHRSVNIQFCYIIINNDTLNPGQLAGGQLAGGQLAGGQLAGRHLAGDFFEG